MTLPRAVALALSITLATGCTRQPAPPGTEAPGRAARSPRERGELRARRDLREGKLRVLVYGNPLSGSNPRREPDSGLPVRVLLDCCVTDEARAETEAYNRVMREAAASRPTPR